MNGIMNTVMENAMRLKGNALFNIKKASPEILIVAGIGCVIGATVLACKATKKANDIVDDSMDELDDTRDNLVATNASDREIAREMLKIKLKTAGKLAAVYGPSAALGAAGIAMIFTSHGIMKKRNGALLAAYNALDAAFRQYRERVRSEEDGFERDRRYLTGESRELIDKNETLRDMANESLYLAHYRNPFGPEVFVFDQYTSKRWSHHSMSNLNVIRSVEDWASTQLRINGHLFLNDVLDELDIEKVPWGQFIGWLKKPDSTNQLKFIAESEVEKLMGYDGLEREEPRILIEFNTDGIIYDQL